MLFFQDQAVAVIFVGPSALAHESRIKGAILVRGGVLKSTLVVDTALPLTAVFSL